MYTSSAAANSENAEPSSVSSRLNASQAKPAPSAKAVMCTTRKNSVGKSLIQLPQGMCSSLSFGGSEELVSPRDSVLTSTAASRRRRKTASAPDTHVKTARESPTAPSARQEEDPMKLFELVIAGGGL